MNKRPHFISGIVFVFGCLILTACGGSGSSSSPESEPATFTAVYRHTDAAVGEPVAVALIGNRNLSEQQIVWQQITGPITQSLDNSSALLSFDMPATDVGFRVEVSNSDQLLFSEEYYFSAQPEPVSFFASRDQMVAEGQNVALRAFVEGISVDAQWRQVQGDAANVQENDGRLMFVAPDVTEDTLLLFEASYQNQTDQVAVLVTNQPQIRSDYFDAPVAQTHAYRQSEYTDVLQACVYSTQLTAPCSVERLPLIGQQADYALEDVLDRVLVSHDWMGRNFERFLKERDPHGDFLNLLGSVSAIVISADVRPSYYWVLTGAIYLDPENLWLQPQERETIQEVADYRSGFGNELQFIMPWRYIKDNAYASSGYSRNVRAERELADLEANLASLLYHELAHANDYFPPQLRSSSSNYDNLVSAFEQFSRRGWLVSDQLDDAFPLQSELMRELAQVSFFGEQATAAQKALMPEEVAEAFAPDSANSYYSYSNRREYLAMLFEEVMLQHRLDIYRDIAVTDFPEQATASTVIVSWGQRSRIGDARFAPLLELVLPQLLPEEDVRDVISGLSEPIEMQAGLSWLDNLVIAADPTANAASQSLTQASDHNLQWYGRQTPHDKQMLHK